jgi:hypothetical protein
MAVEFSARAGGACSCFRCNPRGRSGAPNVERFINLYQSNNTLGGAAARPSRTFHGDYATVNLAERPEMSHITIDKMLALHHAIIPKFLEAVGCGNSSSAWCVVT